MDPTQIWNTIIVNPITWGLQALYGILGNYGLAIIAFTAVVRLVMLPLSMQQMKQSKAMQAIQPKVQALQKLYAKDKEALSRETMKLYQQEGVSPLSGCLPTLVQMPIWVGLYSALLTLSKTPEFASSFLWLENIAAVPSMSNPIDWVLPVITVISQWITQKMMTPANPDPQQSSMNSMMMFMPLMFGVFCFQVPAGLVLYWVASNLFSLVQQYFVSGWGGLAPQAGSVSTAARTINAGTTGVPGIPGGPGAAVSKSGSSGGLLASLQALLPPPSPTAGAPTVKGQPSSSGPAKTVVRFDEVVEAPAPSPAKAKPKRSK